METSSCGEVTMMMPSSGMDWNTVSGASPGSGGQINKHIIDFIPDDVAPELLDDTGDDRPRQTTGEVSSGRSSLMLMVSMPVFVLTGNRPSSLPMAFSWMPKHFGIDGR